MGPALACQGEAVGGLVTTLKRFLKNLSTPEFSENWQALKQQRGAAAQ